MAVCDMGTRPKHCENGRIDQRFRQETFLGRPCAKKTQRCSLQDTHCFPPGAGGRWNHGLSCARCPDPLHARFGPHRDGLAKRLVDCFLECVEQRQRLHVPEGQDLRYVNASYAHALINPEKGVCESSPAEATRRAAGRRSLFVDHEAQTPALRYAREKFYVFRRPQIR